MGDIKRTRRLHARLAYVMRVDNRASIAYAVAPARSVRRGVVSPRGVDAVVIVAVLAAAADTVLVAHQVHPAIIAGNPKA